MRPMTHFETVDDIRAPEHTPVKFTGAHAARIDGPRRAVQACTARTLIPTHDSVTMYNVGPRVRGVR